MRRSAILLGLAVLVYLATGFYVVGGNEKGVVRRCGRAVTTADGRIVLQNSGLHYDLPWPWSQIDRVNINEVRTLTIGSPEREEIDGGPFLQAVDPMRQSQFLSGDKNILNVQIHVHYRISEQSVGDFLFGAEAPEARLKLLAESALADAVIRSGVDFVHTLGRNQLREIVMAETERLAREHRLGIVIDDVTIGGVHPPIRVKAQFVDVMNARADKETYVNQANAYAEQRLADAHATARKTLDEAEIYHRQIVEQARGAADSFTQMVARFHRDEAEGIHSYAAARNMAQQRLYLETMEDVLRRVAAKVLLDSGKPVDLTIFRDPNE